MLTDLENKYKSENTFRAAVDKEKQVAFIIKAMEDSKESANAAGDRKKAAMDALKDRYHFDPFPNRPRKKYTFIFFTALINI